MIVNDQAEQSAPAHLASASNRLPSARATATRRALQWVTWAALLSVIAGYALVLRLSRLAASCPPSGQTEYVAPSSKAFPSPALVDSKSVFSLLSRAREPAPLYTDILQHSGTTSLAAALDVARNQPEPQRTETILGIFERIADDRTLVVILGRALLRGPVAQAEADGTAIIGVLVRVGAFDAALDLAADGPATSRAEWLRVVLPAMAGRQPEAAAEIALSFVAQGVERSIFEQVVRNWASTAPADAAQFALSLPLGDARTLALRTAVDRWLKRDPSAVIHWLPSIREAGEGDIVLASLVTRTDSVTRPTATALAWADRIADATLHFTALEHVLREWAVQDRAAAVGYVEHAAFRITSTQRTQLLSLLNSRSATEPDSSF